MDSFASVCCVDGSGGITLATLLYMIVPSFGRELLGFLFAVLHILQLDLY